MHILDKTRELPGRQSGSAYTVIMVLALCGVVLTVALKVAPAYFDYNIVDNAIEGIISSGDMANKNIREIRIELMRTLNINQVEGFDPNNLVVIEEGGREYLDLTYETRKPVFSNIDAVMKFHNRYAKN